jgi:hypothetical protein
MQKADIRKIERDLRRVFKVGGLVLGITQHNGRRMKRYWPANWTWRKKDFVRSTIRQIKMIGRPVLGIEFIVCDYDRHWLIVIDFYDEPRVHIFAHGEELVLPA